MTYDDWRAAFQLKPCVKCGREFYTPKPDPFVCRACERKP